MHRGVKARGTRIVIGAPLSAQSSFSCDLVPNRRSPSRILPLASLPAEDRLRSALVWAPGYQRVFYHNRIHVSMPRHRRLAYEHTGTHLARLKKTSDELPVSNTRPRYSRLCPLCFIAIHACTLRRQDMPDGVSAITPDRSPSLSRPSASKGCSLTRHAAVDSTGGLPANNAPSSRVGCGSL